MSGKSIATLVAKSLILVLLSAPASSAQKKRVPPGGNLAVVADERLAALRTAPNLSARLVRRLGRGRIVSIRGSSRNRDGLLFFHVAVTRRTLGWVQSEALVAAGRQGDDRRLAHLISGADEFDRVARARIFLDTFPRSSLRAKVLLLLGDAAEEAATRLSRESGRRFERREIPTDGAPEFSYFLNYNGLDRYNRQGVTFTFDRTTKQFQYEGAAWREIVQRYPDSAEADEAKKRLGKTAPK
jgi:predicted pyridoxine 5'-phosphate oxidase superfamily flavin-nucleotide-binding protein